MKYSHPKHQNETNPIPTITSQSSLSKVLHSASEGHARLTTGIFLSRPYRQLLFLALPVSALCLHKIATFITHLPSHERWQLHICFHLLHFQGMDQSIVSERQLRFVKHGLKANSFLTWTHDWISYRSTYGIVKLLADVCEQLEWSLLISPWACEPFVYDLNW